MNNEDFWLSNILSMVYWPSHGQLLSRTPRQRPRLVNFQSKPHIGIGGTLCLFCKKVTQDMNDWHLKIHQDFTNKKNSIYLNPCMIVFGKEIFSERNICFSNKLLGNIYFIDKHIYVLAWHLKKKCSQSTLRSYVLVLPVVCMFIVQSKKFCAKQNEIVFNKPLRVANSSEANYILDKLS